MSMYDEFRKPFNIFSTLIAIFSIALSVYFWQDSERRREPTYLVHKTAKIIDQKIPSKNISVVDSTGQQIKNNVYVVETSFWNAGRVSIETSDVREPIYISLSPGVRILDYSIAAQLKSTILDLNISENYNSKAKEDNAEILLTWKHLDPGLGARIQIIYESEIESDIHYKGEILDASFRNADLPLANYPKKLTKVLSAIFPVVMMFGSAFFIGAIARNFSGKKSFFIQLIFMAIAVCATLFLNKAIFSPPLPPV